jgi:type I site-specific restriction endonuclease
LIVIDEAHRSVYKKYGAIFEYFDSLLVGLTATPKDEIDKNTYRLFDLESGVPTDNYGLDDAVKDGFLVPARAVSVPLKFHREGVDYASLTDEEKEQWDDIDWDDGATPNRVESAALNSWLFNKDTVDKVLEHLMTRGQKVVGRGTRLCEDLFGPDQDKEFFYIFDYCENLDFFKGDPPVTEGSLGVSLKEKLFRTRLELVATLDNPPAKAVKLGSMKIAETLQTGYTRGSGAVVGSLRDEVTELLRNEVAAMNVENFLVRPQRKIVEKYAKPESWTHLPKESLSELAKAVATLPTELEAEDQESKRFDLIILRLQLALLRKQAGFAKKTEQVKVIAALLEEKAAIPLVQQQLAFILEIQSDEWWQDVTVGMLETARKRLRALVKFIEKRQRRPIYTDFEDQMGDEVTVDLPLFASPVGFERFRAKARSFLKEHEDHIAIHKLRMNKALTQSDLDELERILAASGLGQPEDVEKAREECHGLGCSSGHSSVSTETRPRRRSRNSSRARAFAAIRLSSSIWSSINLLNTAPWNPRDFTNRRLQIFARRDRIVSLRHCSWMR